MLLPPHWRQVARERRSQVHKLLKIACLLDDEVCTSPGTHLNPSVCSQFSSFLLCGLSVKNFQEEELLLMVIGMVQALQSSTNILLHDV